MSERGLILALQRLHDDPGFVDLVRQNPQSTLGIYDLDQSECDSLIEAVQRGDNETLRQMAERVGVDWTAKHIHGLGTIEEGPEHAGEGEAPKGLGVRRPNALTGDGYEGVTPTRPV